MAKKVLILCLAILLLVPIGYRLWRMVQPPAVGDLYTQGLRQLAEGDVVMAQLSAEALAAPGVDRSYKDVLEAGVDLKMGRVHAAAARLQAALAQPTTAAVAHAMTGEAFYKNRQFGAAIDMLKEAIKLDESSVDAHRWLAASYYDIGATGPTIQELAKVSELAPDDPRPHRLTGLIYKDMESYDAAIEQYREALQRSSDFPDRKNVLRELAECLLKAGKHDQVDEILKQCPLDAVTQTYSAEAMYARGDLQPALVAIDQALAMDPQHLPALLLKGTLLAELDKLDAAVEVLEQAATKFAQDNRVHYQLSQLYSRLGKTELAEEHGTEATRLRDLRAHFTELHAQASEDLNNAEVRYQLGTTAKQLGLNELAITWFSAALALKPEYVEALQELKSLTGR